MKRRISRRAMAQRIAELEAANARLSDQLRVSLSISEHYLKQQFADDLAKRAAEGLAPDFEQQIRSLYVYSSRVSPPYTVPPFIGGSGV